MWHSVLPCDSGCDCDGSNVGIRQFAHGRDRSRDAEKYDCLTSRVNERCCKLPEMAGGFLVLL